MGTRILNIAIVMPRFTSFGPARATSIDLCIRDLVENSRYRATTRVICDEVEAPFPSVNLEHVRPNRFGGPMVKAWRIASLIRKQPTDLVIVQQHLPTAFVIATRLDIPVLFHTHNFQKHTEKPFRRALRAWRYAGLDGMIMVSAACAQQFKDDWPEVSLPIGIVNNGLDMGQWTAAPLREKEILIIGRAAPEKGILEAMTAVAEVLPNAPGWKARFILSESLRHREYYAQVKQIAARFPDRILILENQTYDIVKSACEKAAIALVLSRWEEPFGRTALEAHAGGAALISSGTGGLTEISGPAALIVNPNEHHAVVAALASLTQDDDLRARLAAEGRRRVVNLFDIKTVASHLDEICQAAMALAGSRG